ncbi:MAG: DUF3795 domain-containing protein [Spirochaetales bacterium]|nr:DUF3795 domain-containing protein [Spirochaetales bacterium]
MQEYTRDYPYFALCGLNCGLCPRFHTDGPSKCPGCGGKDFHLKHPACPVITCSKKHENIRFCFECSDYPCARYNRENSTDSFISYRNVNSDMQMASRDLNYYMDTLNRKMGILAFLLADYNDGRKKAFYCLAVNLLQLTDLEELVAKLQQIPVTESQDIKEKAQLATALLQAMADENKIELKLRK